MKIPLVDLQAQWSQVGGEVRAIWEEVHASGAYTLGPFVERFEEAFAAYHELPHVVGVASGTHALAMALMGLGIGAGDEVIVPAMTFIATAEAVVRAGAWPVLADVDPATGLVTPEAVEAAVGPRTAAIIPVHLYGQPAELASLVAIARRHGLALIEDACQAHGARYRGRRVGGSGEAAAFSFYPAKNLGAYGDGGALGTSDAALAERVRRLRDHGSVAKYQHVELATTARLHALQAAALSVKLPRLDAWNAARRRHARAYGAALAGCSGVELPRELPEREHVWHLYTLRCADPERLQRSLAAQAIGAGRHYPIPLHLQPALEHLHLGPGSFPGAEAVALTTLSLPLYPELPAGVAERVAAVVSGSPCAA